EAHAQGIIHRDIKPANIIVTTRQQAKVMDFGLAKSVPRVMGSEAETQSMLTDPGTVLGTLPYMSPEQVRGEDLDPRTDLFSFGAMLYEMVSGRQPFTVAGASAAATASAILTHEPLPLMRFAPDVPDELQRIVRKCLAKDRQQRYQSARDLQIDLQNIRRERESSQLQKSTPNTNPLQSETVVVQAEPTRNAAPQMRRLIVASIALVAVVGAALVYFLG